MILTFIPLLAIICFLLLCYFFVRRNQRVAQLTSSLAENQLELKTLSSELNLLKEKQAHDTLYDSITGLPGRRVFEDRLAQTLSLSKRNQLIFSVMYLSLDNFNNELGSDIDDELVTEVTYRLQDSIRTIDTVSLITPTKYVFILAQLLKPETAGFVAQRILESIAKPIKIQEKELSLTGRIGIATYPFDSDNAETLMQNANMALQQLESTQAYHFYSANLHALSKREMKLISHLQELDIYHHFKMYYQPVVDIQTQNIICMDALLYWQHPEFGLLALPEFLKLAENNGKIIDIGTWILKNALTRPFLQWGVPKLNSVSIALSFRQLEDTHFAYNLSRMFHEMELDPKCLILEVPEVALSIKLETLEKVFNMLKHMGVKIFLKYGGTGHLSFPHLQFLPVDGIKISRSVIEGVGTNKQNESIVKMIVALGQATKIKIIAEGVETLEQKSCLQELNCHFMQGSFFCAPLEMELS